MGEDEKERVQESRRSGGGNTIFKDMKMISGRSSL
jgi:hypothetical protein